jgi:Uma2 family endonuclease
MQERSSQHASIRSKDMSTTSTALMTAEELMQVPRGYYRAELINGELRKMPLPKLPHGRIATRLGAQLVQFVAKQVWIVDLKHSTLAVYRSESEIKTFSGSDYLEAPDLFPGFRISLEKIFSVKASQ